jgi:hypothetical protein
MQRELPFKEHFEKRQKYGAKHEGFGQRRVPFFLNTEREEGGDVEGM